jgi:enoyl-CoA hydratase
VALAHKIAALDPDQLRTYNRLLDETHDLTYREAVDNEHLRSRDANQKFDREHFDVSSIIGSRRADHAEARGGEPENRAPDQ